tara:strand:- start:6 stop:887 length:882 start_codon:yes stop_codon:yes gene_type:complete
LKKILIIGSSGFIGASLINFFIKKYKKIKIYTISRKKNNTLINTKLINYNLDIKKITLLPNVDNIFYLINSKNINLEKKNFFHFKKLLLKIKTKPKILLSSSGSVYGPTLKFKTFEETSKINIRKINLYKNYKKKYSINKLFLEKEFKKLSKKGFKVSIARCFTFYGINILKYNYAISNIINSLKNGKSIKLIDKSLVVRSYLHEEDMAKWLYKISEFPKNKCEIFNVGSDENIELVNFSKQLSKKYKTKVLFYNKRAKNKDIYLPNINKAKKLLKLKITKKIKNNIHSIIKH